MEGGGGEQEAEGEEEKEVAVPSLEDFPVAHAPPEVVSMISSLLKWKGGRPAGGAPSGARRKGEIDGKEWQATQGTGPQEVITPANFLPKMSPVTYYHHLVNIPSLKRACY